MKTLVTTQKIGVTTMPRMSLRGAGRAADVDHGHLGRLVKAGRLPRGQDGLVELDDVLAIMNKTDPALRRKERRKPGDSVGTGHQPKSPSPVTTPDEAREAIAIVMDVLRSEGVSVNGAVDFTMAKTADMILRVRERALKIAVRRKELVEHAPVLAQISSMFLLVKRTITLAPPRYAPEMAARLNCDPALLHSELDRMNYSLLTEISSAPPTLRV